MKRKILLVLSVVVLISFAFAVNVNAEYSDTETDGIFVYQLNEDNISYKIVEYTGEEKTIVIPEKYNDLPITVIDDYAFTNSEIFYIELSENIKEIGRGAFQVSSLIEFIANDNLEIIDDFAFYDCENLESIYLSGNLKKVGLDAFANCNALFDVTIKNGASGIHYTAFNRSAYSKVNTNSVNEGYNVLYVDKYMLYTESKIYGVFGVKEGIYGIADGACLASKEITAVTISESVKVIGENAVGYYEEYGNIHKIENFKIFGVKGTTAEAYAIENGFEFVEWESIKLDTPEVTVSALGGGIDVEWNEIENAESYILYRRDYNAKTKKWGGWYKLKAKVNSTHYCDATVKLGEYYRYTVKARNGETTSQYKSTETIKYNFAPTVKINNGVNGVTVKVGGAVNSTGSIIYRSTYNTKTKKWSDWSKRVTVKNYVTVWVDKSVENGKTYRYTIKALNGSFKSAHQINPESLKYVKMPVPKAVNSTKGVKVTWDKISGVTGYILYRAEQKNGEWSGWTILDKPTKNTTTYYDLTAKNGTVYRYTLRAKNGEFLSAYKVTSGLICLGVPDVSVAKTNGGITVSWDEIQGATGYTIYRSEYNTKTKKWSSWTNKKTVSSTTQKWVDTDTKSGKTYRYTVRALNGSEKSAYKASNSIKR